MPSLLDGTNKKSSMLGAVSRMPSYKLGLMNAFLFAASYRGQVDTVKYLLSGVNIKAQANVVDDCQRSPLYIAVVRGQLHVASVLVEYGSNCEQVDSNGVSVLSLAAFLVSVGVALSSLSVPRWRPSPPVAGQASPLRDAHGPRFASCPAHRACGCDDKRADRVVVPGVMQGHHRICRLLLRHGAPYSVRDMCVA
jgi:hypothetical protein